MNERNRTRIAAALLVWGVGLASVVASMRRYETTPGPKGDSPKDWPADCDIARRPEGATLLMFLHPHCSCSLASIEELSASLVKGWVGDVHLVMLRSDGEAVGWERGELWDAASRFPGATVHVDPGGATARRFGATTSGHVALFDGSGGLKFSGGLTPTRGTNGGGAVLLGVERGEWSRRPVFGCPLFDDETSEAEGR